MAMAISVPLYTVDDLEHCASGIAQGPTAMVKTSAYEVTSDLVFVKT
jgi:hypothetical protein